MVGLLTSKLYRAQAPYYLWILPLLQPMAQTLEHYTQHWWRFDLIHWCLCLLAAFLLDLGHLVNDWTSQGNEVLLLADLNENIHQQEILSFMASCSLFKSMLSHHPILPPLATFICSNQHGCSPIDGVWATAGIAIQGAMMCVVQHSPGDHHAFIIDVHLKDMIGEPHFKVVLPPARRLCCTIPSSSEQYQKTLNAYCSYHKLPQKPNALFRLAQGTNLDLQWFHQDMESFDKIKLEGMKMTEKCCWKLHMGLVQFSLDLNWWWLLKELWQLVICRKVGRKVWATTIHWMAAHLQVAHPIAVLLEFACALFHQASAKYKEQKPHPSILLIRMLTGPNIDGCAACHAF